MLKRIVIAPDSFKESISAEKAALAIQKGMAKVYPKAEYICIPIADGGEGTVDALVAARDGQLLRRKVMGPMGKPVRAAYGLLEEDTLAIIEMAAASGLELVPRDSRDPLKATTYGTGELIVDALERGVERIIVGVGGSATNDGGVGMAQALGVKFFDQSGTLLKPGLAGGDLEKIASIDASGLHAGVRKGRIRVACDVDNPLTGPKGASAVYGPQKGATPALVKSLDKGLKHLAKIVKRDLGQDVSKVEGAGAAGGLGFGLMSFAMADPVRGVDTILRIAGLKEAIEQADLVVTGEGRIDFQTGFGKAPAGVAKLANRFRVPVVAIGGAMSVDAAKLFEAGFDGLEACVTEICEVDDALKQASRNLTLAGERVARTVLVGQKIHKRMVRKPSKRRAKTAED